MEPVTSLYSVLPNLGIGVVCILALVYVTISFLKAQKEAADKHQAAMDEQQQYNRSIEKEIRTSIIIQLNENTQAFKQVMAHFNAENRR